VARHDRKAKKKSSSSYHLKAKDDKNAPNSESDSSSLERAGFVRRLLAMIYDTLVATAVGVTLVVMLKNGALDLQGYAEPADLIQASFGYKLLIQTWVGLWIAGFFLWFWRRGGQTLGMRAWRLRIYSTVEEPMTWPRLFIRLIASLGGLGTLLVLFDFKNKQSLQDRLAKTEVLKLTKEANDHKSW